MQTGVLRCTIAQCLADSLQEFTCNALDCLSKPTEPDERHRHCHTTQPILGMNNCLCTSTPGDDLFLTCRITTRRLQPYKPIHAHASPYKHDGSELVKRTCFAAPRQRRGSKGPLSPKGSGLPLSAQAAHEAGDVVVDLSPGLSTKPSGGQSDLDTKLNADTAGLETKLSADTAGLDTTASIGIAATVVKKDSFKDAKFYDAKSTTLPVYGKRIGDADVIEGPMEAEPQVLRCAALCCVVLRYAMLRLAELCFAVLWCDVVRGVCCAVMLCTLCAALYCGAVHAMCSVVSASSCL